MNGRRDNAREILYGNYDLKHTWKMTTNDIGGLLSYLWSPDSND